MGVLKVDSKLPGDLVAGNASFKVGRVYEVDKDNKPLKTQGGVPKITISLEVYDANGTKGRVYDDFTSNTEWKIKAFVKSINAPQYYNEKTKEFDHTHILDATGTCILEEREGKMRVKEYIKPIKTTEKVDYSKEIVDDEIPF